MNYKRLLSIFLLAMAQVATADSTKIDFIDSIAKQIDYAENHQQTVWPGFHPAKTPSMIEFYYNEGHKELYALNFTPGNLPWQQTELSYPVYYLPNLSILKQPDLIDGRFMQVDGSDSYIDVEYSSYAAADNFGTKLIQNRMFYYLINESNIDIKNAEYLDSPYDSFNNPDYLKLIFLEDAALTQSQQSDADLAEKALRDAVAIHQYRQQLINDSAQQFENGNEIMVGLPVYTMWTSRNLDDSDYRKMSQRTGCPPLNALAPPLYLISCITNNFPGYMSAVYGRALDRKLSTQPWKEQVEKQFRPISQFAIDFYQFSDNDAKELTTAAMKNPIYRYNRISTIVDNTMLPYVDGLQSAQAKYEQQSGVELRLPQIFGQIFIFANQFLHIFDNLYIPNTQTIMLEELHVHFESKDDDAYLKLDDLPFIIIKTLTKGFEAIDEERSYTSIKLDQNATFIIDGDSYTAEELVQKKLFIKAKKIEITDKHLAMRSANGKSLILDARDGAIKFMEDSSSNTEPYKKMLTQWLQQHHINIQDVDMKKMGRLIKMPDL
jgi:hypothetical protein